ncbi:MAG TPA: protein kinase [Vicinamibacterales bacterium]|nr:protein kinase [Vicinamibacterales bacterium]
MPLPAGARLGPYEILAPLGAGGMGEVYKARDTRLERIVAIKVLPDALQLDAHFRERFEREAKSISALNHPNICTLHDIGHQDGVDYLVMEYLEGETLASRLAKGPLPLAEALKTATEIAGALDKAHRQGIVHRDLKPGNVMLTKTGAKLLDFGLAKTGAANISGVQPTMLPTVTAPLTAQGTLLGTFQYMSPEQVEGEDADARSDVFAFGAVLHEMLTGQKAFTGKSQASLLSAILKDQPPLVSSVQPFAPPMLDRIVKTCLAKDRDDRFQSAHDLLMQLQWVAEGGSAAGVPAPIVAHRKHRERFAWIALAVVTLLWLATLVPAWNALRPPAPATPVEFTITPADVTNMGAWAPLVAPNGTAVIFPAWRSRPGDRLTLWMRPLNDIEARPITGTEAPQNQTAFWSSDSRSIGFVIGTKLLRIDAGGGPVQTICELPGIFMGGAWSRNDEIVFAVIDGRLFRVPASGGTPVELARSEQARAEGFTYISPWFLPDGRHFLITAWHADPDKRAVQVRSIDDAAATTVVKAGSNGIYASPGYVLYHRDGTLVAQSFDATRRVVSGDPINLKQVTFNRNTGRGAFSVSESGVLAYRSGVAPDPMSMLTWYDGKGTILGSVGEAGPYNQMRLSPDEARVALSFLDLKLSTFMVSVLDLSSRITSRVTPAGQSWNDQVWAPTSESIAFETRPKGIRDFYTHTVGSADLTLAFESKDDPKWLDDWSPDGSYLLFHLPPPAKLFYVPLKGDRRPVQLMTSSGSVDGAHFSPDGKWVVYQSNETGSWEVWVASFPAFDHRRQVSAHGGGQAWFRGDSREIFYLRQDGKMMSVTISSEARNGALVFTPPVELFQSPIATPNLTIDQYAVTRDGRRFLFLQPQGERTLDSPIGVVVNWTALLKK